MQIAKAFAHLATAPHDAAARIETSDASVADQVRALRDQMPTRDEATSQQLSDLAQRLGRTRATPKRAGSRTPATRGKPKNAG